MRIALAQINPVIADIQGNREKILSYIARAREGGAELVIFPEMATIGYPPMDLLEKKKLIDDNLGSIGQIAGFCKGIAAVCGYVEYDPDNPFMLFNSAAFMADGMIVSSHRKTLLPAYDVFDELRHFSPAREQTPARHLGRTIGITVCEDIWNDVDYGGEFVGLRKYQVDPVRNLADRGIDLLVSINASPYVRGKNTVKWAMIAEIARKHKLPVVYVNQVGGNDSLIFDGNSACFNAAGELLARAHGFEEELVIFDDAGAKPMEFPREDELEDIRRALVLGLRDYVRKCGFRGAVLGLSGGIDSALTAALAAQALGPENVTGITMPSPFSSTGSVEDSRRLAKNLGIRIEQVRIHELYALYKEVLRPLFSGRPEDVTEENIQARIRGTILMALSNKFGGLLLTTGNKSELSMGYCTLYGDMSGGLAVISDLPKTLVYRLAAHMNRDGEIIPPDTITKPPSAELRENQKDEDSLPPYELLDRILECYIERSMSAEEIIRQGLPEDVVREVLRKVDCNEYKRRQSPPGLKVTSKAFGIGRRIPIAQRYKP